MDLERCPHGQADSSTVADPAKTSGTFVFFQLLNPNRRKDNKHAYLRFVSRSRLIVVILLLSNPLSRVSAEGSNDKNQGTAGKSSAVDPERGSENGREHSRNRPSRGEPPGIGLCAGRRQR